MGRRGHTADMVENGNRFIVCSLSCKPRACKGQRKFPWVSAPEALHMCWSKWAAKCSLLGKWGWRNCTAHTGMQKQSKAAGRKGKKDQEATHHFARTFKMQLHLT
eukprot:363456-Chlamydomonas_euryale.AAC.4